jgi:hypothetical protein
LINSAEALIRDIAAELTGRRVENMSPQELDRWLSTCRVEAQHKPVVLTPDPKGEREIADEPSWDYTFTVATSATARPEVGFPVSWVGALPRPYPQPAAGTTDRRLEVDFVRGKTTATRTIRFTTDKSASDVVDSKTLLATALYRGHLYASETNVTLVGAPTREWVYTPPRDEAAFVIRTGVSARAGAVTILIDLSRSMTDPVNPSEPKGRSRLGEAKKGLEQLLPKLPEGTRITLAYFYGDNTVTPIVERFAPAVTLDGTNWERVYKLVRDVKEEDVKKNGESTPLALAIRKLLHKETGKPFWPSDWSGSRTLIVLTDGDDNWESVYKTDAGNYALAGLLGTDDDVHLHMVFFGLNSAEEKKLEVKAAEQFKILTQPDRFLDKERTPAVVWTGIEDAKQLADLCQRVMLPQFPFRNENDKGRLYRLEASIRGSTVTATPRLQAGVYKFWGNQLRVPQELQLRPGDRVMLDTRRDNPNAKPELFLPEYGFETASELGRPRNSTGTAATGGIRGTLPLLKLDNGSNYADLSAVMTLEPIGRRRDPSLLDVTRPRFVWFDSDYADGKPAEKGLKPCLRIENRWPLWAPAWNLTMSRWAHAGSDVKTVRHPLFTGYWLDSYPVAQASFPINLNDLPGSLARMKDKTANIGDVRVTLLDITREKDPVPGFPPGEYLTVRFKYGKPGDYIFVRPGNFKGPEQPYKLYERHVYYDEPARYTARFGPVYDTDPNKDITLDVYSIADLKELSKQASRSVEVRLPPGPLPTNGMPQELEIQPRKE